MSRVNTRVIIYLAIIIGGTLVVYYPSFTHLLRGETYTFFMDVAGNDSALSLIKNCYNYEMVRVFDEGDTLVFRPIIFSIIGMEKALFGANYTCWHITSFLFHLTSALCLFRLLWKIRPSILAMLATLLFSTTFIIMNTVLYQPVAAYALFMAIALTGFYYSYCGVKLGKTRHLVFAAISMVVACFCLEFGIVLTVLLIGYFWLERKHPQFNWKRWSLVFIVIVLVYLASYVIETFMNPTSTTATDYTKMMSGNIGTTMRNVRNLGAYWIHETILPANLTATIDTNFRRNAIEISQVFPVIPLMFNALALAIIGISLFAKARRDKKGRGSSTPFLCLLTGSVIAIVVSVGFFRGTTHSDTYLLRDCNSSIYFFVELFILMVYAFISKKQIAKYTGLISLALIILISLSAPLTFSLNRDLKTAEEPMRAYFQEIDNFVESHRKEYRPEDEPDFSFNSTIVPSDVEKRMEILLWKGVRGTPERTPYYFTMPEVLYWNDWSNDNPKYTLTYYYEEGIMEVEENE